MIAIEKNERGIDDYPFIECPESWIPYISKFIDEVDNILSLYNLPYNTVDYLDVKEKFGQLRIYHCIQRLLEDDLTEEEDELYHTIEGIVSLLADKCERKIKKMIEKGIL